MSKNLPEKERRRTSVRLISGRLFDPWAPEGPAPSFATCVHAGANLCRYGGHVERFFSVAEHTLWGLVAVLSRGDEGKASVISRSLVLRSPAAWGAWLNGADPSTALTALLFAAHDAPEMLGLVDVPGPVRRRPEMSPYNAADARLLRFLCVAWDLPPRPEEILPGVFDDGTPGDLISAWERVDAVDRAMLGAERAVRPEPITLSGLSAPGHEPTSSEEVPVFSWLDLSRDLLCDGESRVGREWLRWALRAAWAVLRDRAGLPSGDGVPSWP